MVEATTTTTTGATTTTAHPNEGIKGLHINDILKDSNCDLILCHQNIRGDYTLQFQNRQTGQVFTFANVNAEHVPQQFRQQQHMETGTVIHLPFDQVVNNNRYALSYYHKNFRGDYTMVFMDQFTGMGITYANVNPEHIPQRMREELGITDMAIKHVHLQDVYKDPGRFELVREHPNPLTYTLVFRDKMTDHRFTFSNVRADHIPENIRQGLTRPNLQ